MFTVWRGPLLRKISYLQMSIKEGFVVFPKKHVNTDAYRTSLVVLPSIISVELKLLL